MVKPANSRLHRSWKLRFNIAKAFVGIMLEQMMVRMGYRAQETIYVKEV